MKTPTQTPFVAKPILLSTVSIGQEVLEEIAETWSSLCENIEHFETDVFMFSNNTPVPDRAGMLFWNTKENRYRMRHSWFETNITKRLNVPARNIVIWHFTPEQRKEWGLPETINGTYWLDNNDVLEAYICCDWAEMAKDDRATVDMLEILRLILHEAGHGLVHFSGRRDELLKKLGAPKDIGPVHYADYVLKDVTQVYHHISFEKWSMLNFIKNLLIYLIPLYQKAVEEKPTDWEQRREYVLDKWALAIQDFEGWFPPGPNYPTGSRSYRQNNPGNLRWSPFEDNNVDNFSVFETYHKGFNALKHQLKIALNNKSRVYHNEMTLTEFFEKYAPSSDNNYPEKYAAFVARQLGVASSTRLKNLITLVQ